MRTLVEDTLFQRRMHRDATCFTWNAAGAELLGASANALPVIEDALLATVVPALDVVEDENDIEGREALSRLVPSLAPSDIGDSIDHRFPGLTLVFAAYLFIGNNTDSDRVCNFLSSLPERLRAHAIMASTIAFGRPLAGLPRNRLLAFFREEACSKNEFLRASAANALTRFSNPAL